MDFTQRAATTKCLLSWAVRVPSSILGTTVHPSKRARFLIRSSLQGGFVLGLDLNRSMLVQAQRDNVLSLITTVYSGKPN